MPAVWFYRLSGALVASEIELPTAKASPELAQAGAILFRLAPLPGRAPPSSDAWTLRDHGALIGKTPDGFVVRLPGCADFWIAADGAAVTGAPLDACPESTLAQLFLDQILPLALHARGQFSLHASSVAVGGRDLCAFLGNSGAGKSTLASSLAREGAEVLFSDDCLTLQIEASLIVAHPSYASTRLWPESAGALFADRDPLPLA